LHGAILRIQAHPQVTEILLGVGAEGLGKISGRIRRELVVEPMPAYHPEQFQITSEGERVELLAPPDAPVEIQFDETPDSGESLALDDEAGPDELDAEPLANGADEAPLDELPDAGEEKAAEEPNGPDLRDA
jgi:hypothetical protein